MPKRADIEEWKQVAQVAFVVACFIATLILNLIWWLQLKNVNGDANSVLSTKVADVVLAATILLVVISFVLLFRVFKPFRRFTTDYLLVRSVVTVHTTLAPLLVALAWYDSLTHVDEMNSVYRARSMDSMVNVKLQSAALVFTFYSCKYVAARMHRSTSGKVYPVDDAMYLGSTDNQPLLYGYDKRQYTTTTKP
jgi:hypothetical protein